MQLESLAYIFASDIMRLSSFRFLHKFVLATVLCWYLTVTSIVLGVGCRRNGRAPVFVMPNTWRDLTGDVAWPPKIVRPNTPLKDWNGNPHPHPPPGMRERGDHYSPVLHVTRMRHLMYKSSRLKNVSACLNADDCTLNNILKHTTLPLIIHCSF